MSRIKDSKRVLVIGPSHNTKGGISFVIKAYQDTRFWLDWNCVWIPTFIDKSAFHKVLFMFLGFSIFLSKLPFSRIVHIHLSWDTSAVRKLPFFLMAKLFKKKLVVHLHSGAEPILDSKVKRVYQFYFKYADVTILLANSIKEKLSQSFKFHNSIVLFNPCIVNPNPEYDLAHKNILFAGSINERKGVYDLLNAFSKVSVKYPDWKLQIAGSGEIERMESEIEMNNVREQTEFLGWIKDANKDEVFSKTSIFCLPSYTEGLPMSVLDAWAYGLPVVTTPVGGISDIAKDRENMLLFQSGDISGLTEALTSLISNPDLRSKLSSESLKLSQTVFSISSITNQLDLIYQNLTKK